jgi:hypothetical protein
MHALSSAPEMGYVLGLQEAVVICMADGYARASGKLVSCNVHVAPGLGNAIGSIYTSLMSGTPMIVTAGQQEQGHGLTEPLLYAPLVPIASPVVKWATEVSRIEDLFQANARVERYEVSNKFYSCKMEENSSVSEHILKMSGYHNHLTQLGVNLPDDSVIDRVLQSLPPSYKGFVMNYNMQGMEKTIPELFAMLKAAEVEIKKEHQVLMVNKTASFKKKGKGKKGNFKKNGRQVATPGKKPKAGPKPETECFYCKGNGH